MKLRTSIALIAGIVALSFSDIKAQTTQPAPSPALKAAEEMLIASGGKEQFEKSAAAGMTQALANIPQEKRAKFTQAMTTFLGKYVTWEIMKPDLCQVYAREFTVAELKELTAFYKSPIGIKFQAKTPIILQTTMALSQKAVADHQAELQQLMMDAMQ
ncbi:DUF2059 domain-containing protein [Mucilaginibacter myungsuensis]|uniref:DUF2059 domain-containing protein n=1 Tax=Mucilaginibacter myungsuensis TaxID=649104 RepID=A0A929L3T6_9SPHI|nr:DUF2059 domain-containing protein [Mucilaginibacter myungsuensis]MBE9663510.1 DUF2059 domain-containing protein [Mucilaginibacter myungsuensis]MDN3600248.1 DUF2059 domain-containing protein [Mucilaginibacter myungsuensis]